MPAEYPDIGWPYPVPRVVTALTPYEMAPIFYAAHKTATGRPPGSRTLLRNALAIVGLENGNGGSILNHNWGNLQADLSNWTGPYWFHPQPQAGQPFHFRSYPTHAAGAAAWWRQMYKNWRPALRAAAAGRPRAMVGELYRQPRAYVVGGSQKAYADTVVRLADSYRKDNLFLRAVPMRSDWIAIGAGAAGLIGTVVVGVMNRGRNY